MIIILRAFLSETYDNRKKRYINKPGVRNEPLDTLVYSFAALHHQRIRADRFTENDWNKYLFRKLTNPQSQKFIYKCNSVAKAN